MKSLFAFTVLLSFASVAQPRSVKLSVVHLEAQYSPAPEEAKFTVRQAIKFIKAQTHVTLKMVEFKSFKTHNPTAANLGPLLGDYQPLLAKRKASHAIELNLFPPILNEVEQRITVTGHAILCGLPTKNGDEGWADAYVANHTPSGLPMSSYAFWTIVHELGHAIGADHDTSETPVTVMNTLLLHFLPLPYVPEFSSKSKREINRCFRELRGQLALVPFGDAHEEPLFEVM